MTEASRKLYGGLDLHSSNVYCGIVDQDGNRVFAKRLPTNGTEILDALEPYRSDMQAIAVESTYNWYWLVDELLEMKYPARLANPAAMQQYTGLKVSTDRNDAFWLAEMLRLDILPEGYIYPHEIRPVRDMLRRRLLMRRQRTQMLLSLQSMIQRQTSRKLSSSKVRRWTKQDPKTTATNPIAMRLCFKCLVLSPSVRLSRPNDCQQRRRSCTLPGLVGQLPLGLQSLNNSMGLFLGYA